MFNVYIEKFAVKARFYSDIEEMIYGFWCLKALDKLSSAFKHKLLHCGRCTTRTSSLSIANAAAAGPGLPLRLL